jgi:hypothetical protein
MKKEQRRAIALAPVEIVKPEPVDDRVVSSGRDDFVNLHAGELTHQT